MTATSPLIEWTSVSETVRNDRRYAPISHEAFATCCGELWKEIKGGLGQDGKLSGPAVRLLDTYRAYFICLWIGKKPTGDVIREYRKVETRLLEEFEVDPEVLWTEGGSLTDFPESRREGIERCFWDLVERSQQMERDSPRPFSVERYEATFGYPVRAFPRTLSGEWSDLP